MEAPVRAFVATTVCDDSTRQGARPRACGADAVWVWVWVRVRVRVWVWVWRWRCRWRRRWGVGDSAARRANEALRVLRLGEGQVEPLAAALHLDDISRDPVARDCLLEREQRARHGAALAELHLGLPGVLDRRLVALVTVARVHHKLDDQRALERVRARQHLGRHGQLDLEPAAVWLGPDPARVHLHRVKGPGLCEGQGWRERQRSG